MLADGSLSEIDGSHGLDAIKILIFIRHIMISIGRVGHRQREIIKYRHEVRWAARGAAWRPLPLTASTSSTFQCLVIH